MAFTVCVPGDNLQTKASAGAAGDTFWLTSGTYTSQKVLPLDGQRFIGPVDAILDGAATTDFAFYYSDPTHPKDVTLAGFTIQNYTGGAGRAALLLDNTYNWTLENLTVLASTAGRGIEPGQGTIIRGCKIGNHFLAGMNGFQANGLVIDNCEFFNNNTSHNDPDTPSGEGCGFKLGTCIGVQITNCYVHDNYGPGMWLDLDCHNVQFVNCVTQRNSHRGFEIEISDTVQIIHATCIQDGLTVPNPPGAAGIFTSTSSNVEISQCTFMQCQAGATTFDDPTRGTGPYGPRRLTNYNPHDNIEKRYPDTKSGVVYLIGS